MTIDVAIPKHLHAPRWGEFGEDVYLRTYSRVKSDGTRENWAETVKRVVDGNCNFVGKRYIEKGEPEKLFELIYDFGLLPGGRHLWVTGVKNREYTSNCWASSWDQSDFSRHFTFSFARLMEGGGVGANYSNCYLKHYKAIPNKVNLHIVCDADHKDFSAIADKLSKKYSASWDGSIQIGDNREGWVDTLGIVIQEHFEHKRCVDSGDLVLDVSHVRPSGSRLKSFGGTASGPAALVEMLRNVNEVMNKHVGKKPDSFLALSLDHEIARCVVAGNVRRSARISVKHWRDDDILKFIDMKKDGDSHWTTNISVIVDSDFWRSLRHKDKYAKKILRVVSEGMLSNGEPGVFNISKASEGELFEVYSPNPCGEIALQEWGSCNLGSVNLKYFANKTTNDLLEAFRLMARFLIRATFADYPDPTAKEIVERDRRLGVGITGFADWQILEGHTYSHFPSCEGQKKKLALAAEKVRKEARHYAFQLRIPEPIKTTTAAPTGSTSKLCGCSEGIQPILFKYFKRRVNFSTTDADQAKIVERLAAAGYEVEDSHYTTGTKVVSYSCQARVLEEPGIDEEKVEDSTEISLEECLAVQKTIQEIYADNSVSFTINVDPEVVTLDDLENALVAFGPDLKGTTVFPTVSNRPQLPYEKLTKASYEKAKHKHADAGEANCKGGICHLPGKSADDDGSL